MLAVENYINDANIYSGANIIAASLPGMWERTITIGSGGKTFSATGWKVTWLDFPHFILPVVFLSCLYVIHSPRLAGPSALDT